MCHIVYDRCVFCTKRYTITKQEKQIIDIREQARIEMKQMQKEEYH